MSRKLASVRRIASVQPIPGADAIEVAQVDGWKVVVKKGEYAPGDLAVYCEIDSWIPHALAPFLSPAGHEPKVYAGVAGQRLRTVKLRGQLSQGLLLPVQDDMREGEDVTERLGILKWEAPISVRLAGEVRGVFPAELVKTEQERCQNLASEIESLARVRFELTEKLDGTSATYYLNAEGRFRVCSRNMDLRESETNLYWRVARQLHIEEKMREAGLPGIALQGEIIGEGVQGNQYQCKGHRFLVFDVCQANEGHWKAEDRRKLVERLGLEHVPVLDTRSLEGLASVEALLNLADGSSVLNGSRREGIVFKSVDDPRVHFKAISNVWLLKQG